jgi:hypothetical protein
MGTSRRVALVVLVLFGLGSAARGDDAGPPMRKALPKIAHPFLDGLVGSWDVAFSGLGVTGAGRTRIRRVAEGTALLQETFVEAGGRKNFATSVLRVTADGKDVKLWRFGIFANGELSEFQGPLAADALVLKAGDGTMTLRKTDKGYESTLVRGANPGLTSTYTKSSTDADLPADGAPKEGLQASMVGTWDVAGEWSGGMPAPVKITGTSVFRWTLGGSMLVHEFSRTTPMGVVGAVGLHRWPAERTAEKVWWFDQDHVDPQVATGPATDTGWQGAGAMPDGTAMKLAFSKKGDGFEMRYELGGKPAGSETFTRAK